METQGGDITVDAPLDGEARLTTAGGDVRSSDITGVVRIETAGGSIALGKIGGDLIARTAGGSIRVGDVKGDAILETSGGEIVTGAVAGRIESRDRGRRRRGGRRHRTSYGPNRGRADPDWTFRRQRCGPKPPGAASACKACAAAWWRKPPAAASICSRSKAPSALPRRRDAFWRNSFAPRKPLAPPELETSMGDVYVYLPADMPLTIDAAIDTAAGRQIHSDFPLDIQGGKEELVPSTLRGHGTLNGGGDVLKMRTVAGNIEIRKIDEASLRELQQREESNWNAWQERHAEKDQPAQEWKLQNGDDMQSPSTGKENEDELMSQLPPSDSVSIRVSRFAPRFSPASLGLELVGLRSACGDGTRLGKAL